MIKQANAVNDSRSGRCQCGSVLFQVPEMPLTFYACHCTDCRAQSASAFGLSYLIRPEGFLLVSGKLKIHEQPLAGGGQKIAAFCHKCGSRIYHAASDPTELISIKAGNLDDIRQLMPIAHIWTDSALPWVVLPEGDIICFKGQPAEACLISLWADQLA